MTPTHVHLMLNHFSVIGSIFGVVLVVVGMVRNSRELVTLALASVLGVAMLSIPVYFTGEPAQEAIARQAGVPAEVVERHAQAAQFAFFAVEWVGALALAGLWLFRTEATPRWFLAILLAGSVLTAGVMVYTANQGRQIRHPDITSFGSAVKKNGLFGVLASGSSNLAVALTAKAGIDSRLGAFDRATASRSVARSRRSL